MKKVLMILSIWYGGLSQVDAQSYIQSVTTKTYSTPKVSSTGSPADAVLMILDALNFASKLNCANQMKSSLQIELVKARNQYNQEIPSGKTIELLALVNTTTCEIYALIPTTQTIHIQEGSCSIHDIQLTQPDLLFDATTTGFFTLKMAITE